MKGGVGVLMELDLIFINYQKYFLSAKINIAQIKINECVLLAYSCFFKLMYER